MLLLIHIRGLQSRSHLPDLRRHVVRLLGMYLLTNQMVEISDYLPGHPSGEFLGFTVYSTHGKNRCCVEYKTDDNWKGAAIKQINLQFILT